MEIRFIKDLHQIVNSAGDTEQILANTAKLSKDITNGALIFIYLPNYRHKLFIHPVAVDFSLSLKAVNAFECCLDQIGAQIMVFEKAYQHPAAINLPLVREEQIEAFFGIPLIFRDKNIGFLSILHKKPHFYAENEILMIETLAYFMASAVYNSMIYEETQIKAVQLEKLFQISQLLVSGGYLEEILTFIAGTVVETMKVQVCSIILANEEHQIFYFKAIACPDKSYHQSVATPINHFVCGRTYFSRTPTYVSNIKLEKQFATPDLARKYDLHSMLSVPMTCQAKIIGVFNIYTTALYQFKEEETHLLQLIANQVASVVHETYLTKEVIKTKRDLIAQKKLQRAKSILIKKHQLSEEEAHRLILRRSMELRKPILEIVENIINGQVTGSN